MKPLFRALIFLCLMGSLAAQTQYEIEILERYTNSFQNKDPKGKVYLVLGFSDELVPYFFDKNNECLLAIVKESKEIKKINKSAFFKNPKNKMWEYYELVSNTSQLSNAPLFDMFLVSTDTSSFTKVSFTEKDKDKLVKTYQPPAADASAKEKLKYYQRTGDRQGQLMGQAKIVEIQKRMSCSVKKKKFRKEGVNGNKEMIYGF